MYQDRQAGLDVLRGLARPLAVCLRRTRPPHDDRIGVLEMARGRGVRLQRYRDGGLSDLKTFKAEQGLAWTDTAGRAFSLTLAELNDWRGNRADAGRLAPKGFPRTNTFAPLPGEGRGKDME